MNNTEQQKKTIRKVLRYLKPYKLNLLISIIAAVVTVSLTLYFPILIGRAVDAIAEIGQPGTKALLISLLIKMAFVAAGGGLAQWLLNLNNNKIAYNVIRTIREEAFAKIETLPLSYLDRHSHGDILSRVITDADQLADGLLIGFTQLFTGIITIAGTLIFMLSVNPYITAVVVILTPVSLFVANFIAKRTFSMFKLQSEARGEQTALVNEMIGNQKVVQAFAQEQKVLERFDTTNESLQKYSLRAIFYSSLTNPCTRFVNSLVYAGVGLTGALFAIAGGLSIGQLTCFLAYANQYTKPFNEISEVITELQGALACAARILELVEAPPEAPDAPHAAVISQVKGQVTLSAVSFSYTPDRKLIEDLNLSARAGQRIAIVGPTGCGKTTIINLLMRFYDIQKGQISVDGINVSDITKSSLRASYGMVLQETWLKRGTIMDNIKMGRPQASQEEILQAARATHAHSFIKRLPEGYHTMIGEDGGSLSQGQKQLLCITRVMLALPPMLILDEATSSIDTRTELKIQDAFARLMKGRTSFIVAHRLSTIRNADIILVMNAGKIVEQGQHDELLEKQGYYANLYNSQFQLLP